MQSARLRATFSDIASRCELHMAPRRRRGRRHLRLWWRSLRLWCGSLRLWCGSPLLWCRYLLLWCGGQRLFCSRWRRDRVHRRRWDLRWSRRDLPQGGRPDRCCKRNADRQLRSTDHAQGNAHQSGDQRILSVCSPPRRSHRFRRRYAVMFRCGHTPAHPLRRDPNCRFARKSSGDSRLQPVTIPIIAGASRLHCYRLMSIR